MAIKCVRIHFSIKFGTVQLVTIFRRHYPVWPATSTSIRIGYCPVWPMTYPYGRNYSASGRFLLNYVFTLERTTRKQRQSRVSVLTPKLPSPGKTATKQPVLACFLIRLRRPNRDETQAKLTSLLHIYALPVSEAPVHREISRKQGNWRVSLGKNTRMKHGWNSVCFVLISSFFRFLLWMPVMSAILQDQQGSMLLLC